MLSLFFSASARRTLLRWAVQARSATFGRCGSLSHGFRGLRLFDIVDVRRSSIEHGAVLSLDLVFGRRDADGLEIG